MNLYCTKCSVFKKHDNIKIKREKDGKFNLYYRCNHCGFKKFKTINEKEFCGLLKV